MRPTSWANAHATVAVYLLAQPLPGGWCWVLEDDRGHRPDQQTRFARVAWRPIGEVSLRRYSSTEEADDCRALLVVDVFGPDGSAEEVHDIYAIDRASDAVLDALRRMSIPLTDYTDAAAPVVVAQCPIRAIESPSWVAMESTDGYQRRQISAELRWISRSAA